MKLQMAFTWERDLWDVLFLKFRLHGSPCISQLLKNVVSEWCVTAGDFSLKKSPCWSSVSSNCSINAPVTMEGSVFLCDLLCWLVKNGQLLFHLVQPFHGILINRRNWNRHTRRHSDKMMAIYLSVADKMSLKVQNWDGRIPKKKTQNKNWQPKLNYCFCQNNQIIFFRVWAVDLKAINITKQYSCGWHLKCTVIADPYSRWHHVWLGGRTLLCGSIMSKRGLDPVDAAAPRVRTPLSAASITPLSKGTLSLVLV